MTPTTDTYSLPQTQEEFYFALPTETLDVVLYAHNQGRGRDAVAVELDRDVDAVTRAFQDIDHRLPHRADPARTVELQVDDQKVVVSYGGTFVARLVLIHMRESRATILCPGEDAELAIEDWIFDAIMEELFALRVRLEHSS